MAKVTVLTYDGEEWAAGRLVGSEATTGKYIGWGSGDGTALKGDTTLATEESETRVVGDVTLESTGATAKYVVEGTLIADGTKTITNAANFSAITSGTMIVHTSFDGIDLDLDDEITFTITIDPS
jgi:hypothetical protein